MGKAHPGPEARDGQCMVLQTVIKIREKENIWTQQRKWLITVWQICQRAA